MLTDSHCHITSEFYDDIESVMNNAKNNGVHRIISCASGIKSSKEVHENSYKYKNYYYALGIHPENQDEDYKEMEHFFYYCLPNSPFRAIGEIGLDYHYENYDKEKQINLFEKQLEFAERENFPVIVHSREATKDTIDCLKRHHNRGVIHCFSGSLEIAREYLKLGFYIGVGGVLTFKNSKLKEVIKEIPLDRLIVETDSPFLSPEPLRGKKNEPANVKIVAEYLAELKGVSFEELSRITEENVETLFDR